MKISEIDKRFISNPFSQLLYFKSYNTEGFSNFRKKYITFKLIILLFLMWTDSDNSFYFNLNKNKSKNLAKRKVIFG